MRAAGRLITAATFTLSLAACGSPSADKAADPGASTSATASATTSDGAPVAFAQCKTCHAVEAGKNGLGPSLAGVFGRKAGTAAGFAFSPAIKASGLTWDEVSLDAYLTSPMKTVPGGKMSYAGQPDAAKRKDVIEYLKTLK